MLAISRASRAFLQSGNVRSSFTTGQRCVVSAALVGLLIGKFAERRVAWSAARQVLILLIACGATYLVGRALGVSVN